MMWGESGVGNTPKKFKIRRLDLQSATLNCVNEFGYLKADSCALNCFVRGSLFQILF